MALRKTVVLQGTKFVQTEFGKINKGVENITLNAYIKVTSVSGNKSMLSAKVAFNDGENSVEKQYQIPVSVDSNAKNFIAQAYEHLKTLPEFAGATDC